MNAVPSASAELQEHGQIKAPPWPTVGLRITWHARPEPTISGAGSPGDLGARIDQVMCDAYIKASQVDAEARLRGRDASGYAIQASIHQVKRACCATWSWPAAALDGAAAPEHSKLAIRPPGDTGLWPITSTQKQPKYLSQAGA